MEKRDVKSLTLPKLTQAMAEIGQPKFRAGQVYSWLHDKKVNAFDQMTNLPAALRSQLDEIFYINAIRVKKKLVSDMDGTVKYLYELFDGNCVETVLMQHRHGNSLCISSQVGCRMGCKFCASTLGGKVRDLYASEMLDQVYMTGIESGRRIDSIVLMGIGEPLDNMENVLAFLKILSSPQGLNMSLRHVSLSTCGLVDQIYELAEHKLQLTLSVSLHAPNNEIRDRSMPVNRKYPIEALLAACKDYFQKTGRRVSFEYALIKDTNDQMHHADELARRLRGMGAHVNLIPVNPVAETGFSRGSKQEVEAFKNRLLERGINATVRRELGTDIAAACGQLRRQEADRQRTGNEK